MAKIINLKGLKPLKDIKNIVEKSSSLDVNKIKETFENGTERVKKSFEPDIQVMMLGARRVGKTSILASMIGEFNKITSETNLVLTKEKGGKAIDDALINMKGYFAGNPKAYEYVSKMDTNSTSGFEFFDLELSIANKTALRSRKIRFWDCAGEWITNYANEEKIAEKIEKSDVVIIAIDSVLLMENKGQYNHQNAVENVTNFIKKHMAPSDSVNNHKMVLFVPLKCEKYYWQNIDKDGMYYGKRMAQLNKAVKDAYEDLFVFFAKENNRPYFDVAIMPILTIGGIEFYEFTCNKDAFKVLTEDMRYAYSIQPEFNPQYCEMPLIYTLLFEYWKIKNEYESKTFGKNGKKKMTSYIREWIQDKKNLAKDTDYMKEMEKLKNIISNNKDAYLEIVQGRMM